jgi:hypothetical protein
LDSVSLRVPSNLIMKFTFLVLEKRWAPVLQLDARQRQIRFTNLWIFLALRRFIVLRNLAYYYALFYYFCCSFCIYARVAPILALLAVSQHDRIKN